jgi:hypothetical protein
MLRHIPMLAVLLLAACDAFTAPDDARPYEPPPEFLGLWQRLEQCSGRSGDFARVRWYVTDGPLELDGTEKAGVWEAPHSIYMLDSYVVDAYRDYVAVRHEMLHDLTQRSGHGSVFSTCDALM